MISQSSIEEIKRTVKLSTVVAESIQLTRRGSSLVGCCPFHAEKTPSFHINENENYYHCFGCGESGNVISWFMKTQGLAFPVALEYIAEKYGISLRYEGKQKESGPKIDKKIFYTINLLAYKFYRHKLEQAPALVKNYLTKRFLTTEVCDYFGIGFAPLEWRSLSDYLVSKGHNTDLIVQSGLARRNSKGELYDTFRARVIFPIWLDARRIVAFGGRIVPELVTEEASQNAPKYINSPESPVYHKSSVFFALPQANTAIRANNTAIIVEGYLDVISLHRVGVQNTIATCGTALTVEHVKRLKGLSRQVVLLFDGDQAGRQASARSFKAFLNSGIDARALFLPEGEDPDTLANKYDANTAQHIAKLPTKSLLSCYIEDQLKGQNIENIGAGIKGKISAEIAQQLKTVNNAVERSELIKETAFLLNIEASEFANLIKDTNYKIKLPSTEVVNDQVKETNVTFKIEDASRYELDMLYSVMALKEDLPNKILTDPVLVEELNPAIIEFVSELHEVLNSKNLDDPKKKELIKELLNKRGAIWLKHWKEAYNMNLHRDVDMRKMFDECCQAFHRRRFQRALEQAQNQIDNTTDVELKAFLINQKIQLLRRSKGMNLSL